MTYWRVEDTAWIIKIFKIIWRAPEDLESRRNKGVKGVGGREVVIATEVDVQESLWGNRWKEEWTMDFVNMTN